MSNLSANQSHSSEKPKRPRRTFSEDFKRDAVNLVVNEGYAIADAARAVNVTYKTFREWYDKLAPEPTPCGDDASVDQLKEENKRLRKQLKQAEMEREILKKATAYFAKESQ
jgi:transposase